MNELLQKLSTISSADELKPSFVFDTEQELWDIPGKGYFAWVRKNWTSRGMPLDFEDHKFLVEIYKDQSPHIVWMKSAQAGITERALTEAIWLADRYYENAVYVFPTTSAISDLVQERVDEPLNNSPYLQRVSGRAKRIMGKQADKVGLKRMSKGFVYFRGSNKTTQITSIPADIIFGDEVDRMIQENVPYIPKRLGHSSRKWQRWLSTPTLPNFGIHKMFIESDQREYHVTCNHCSTETHLDFFEHVQYEMKNDIECERAWVECPSCKQEIVPYKLEGRWIPKYPDRKIRGYYINKLYTPHCDLIEMVENSKKTSEYEIQQFYNQDLGLPYSPKGGTLTQEILFGCKRDYRMGVQEGSNYMGVDVGRHLHVIIQNKEKVLNITKVVDFDDLDKLMKDYNIHTCVIDALPETRKAQEFAQRFMGRVYMCYYSKLTEPKNDEWFQAHPAEMKVNTRRTLALDNWSARFRDQKVQLPAELADQVEFLEHMTALTRIIREDKTGNQIAEYIKTGPDHYYHAGNYSNLALAIANNVTAPEIFGL